MPSDQSLVAVSFAFSSSRRVTKILWQSCKCTSLICKPYDIARKFNDYSPHQYKVHLQIICLQKLPSLFLKPLVSRSVHSLSPGVFSPWLLLNHYLSICYRLVHCGFGFELHVCLDFFSAHFYLLPWAPNANHSGGGIGISVQKSLLVSLNSFDLNFRNSTKILTSI